MASFYGVDLPNGTLPLCGLDWLAEHYHFRLPPTHFEIITPDGKQTVTLKDDSKLNQIIKEIK